MVDVENKEKACLVLAMGNDIVTIERKFY